MPALSSRSGNSQFTVHGLPESRAGNGEAAIEESHISKMSVRGLTLSICAHGKIERGD
jgi:hypothetical protein